MKKQSTEMEPVRQKRFTSPNPDLGMSTSIPRCTEYDLKPEGRTNETYAWRENEFSFKAPKTGNCVRGDGRS